MDTLRSNENPGNDTATKTSQHPTTKVHNDDPVEVTSTPGPRKGARAAVDSAIGRSNTPHTVQSTHPSHLPESNTPPTAMTVNNHPRPAGPSTGSNRQPTQPAIYASPGVPTYAPPGPVTQQVFSMGSLQRALPAAGVYQSPAPHLVPHSPLQHQLAQQQQRFSNPASQTVSYPAQMQQAYAIPTGDHTQAHYSTFAGYQSTAPPSTTFVQSHDVHYSMYSQLDYTQQAMAYVPVPYAAYSTPHGPHAVAAGVPAPGGHAWYPQTQPQQQPGPWPYYPQMSPVPYPAMAPAQPSKQQFNRMQMQAVSKPEPSLQSYPLSPSSTATGSVSSGAPSLPRGPPRKPKKSGNGLWVGNLPPGTSVAELKDYFSQGAKKEIQSVYLIAKSNCAFINYRTDAALMDAMQRFHDSRFKNTRLVCRTQRPEAEKFPGANSNAEAKSPSRKPTPPVNGEGPATVEEKPETTDADGTSNLAEQTAKVPPSGPSGQPSRPRVYGKNRYFIVKSLTVEDMDFSVKNGIWATQGHNETVLNEAFSTAENVYLIFSANKSGEYFGYARMASPIVPSNTSTLPSLSPMPSLPSSTPLPKAIITPETDDAPRGCIYDDSARGSIFWEADPDSSILPQTPLEPNSPVPASAGTPFRVQWLSTQRLPFYRCRNLRNPWNSNREVKVARDGTELETNLGQRLVAMFHPHPSRQPQQQSAQQQPMMPGPGAPAAGQVPVAL